MPSRTEANAEVKAKYANAIDTETARLESAIAAAKEARDTEKRKALQKELADYEKRMADTHRHRNTRTAQGEISRIPSFSTKRRKWASPPRANRTKTNWSQTTTNHRASRRRAWSFTRSFGEIPSRSF